MYLGKSALEQIFLCRYLLPAVNVLLTVFKLLLYNILFIRENEYYVLHLVIGM